jgi:hypothetical protein
MFDPFFAWVEGSALSVWIVQSPSIFAFPFILALHTIGLGLVAGLNVALDLRILGVAEHVPLAEFRRFLPFMWFGFWLNAASGVALLIAYPTKALTNPVFYLKLALIAVALVLLSTVRRRVLTPHGGRSEDRPLQPPAVAHDPIPARVKVFAAVSILCWAGATVAGRFLAYTYSRLTVSD